MSKTEFIEQVKILAVNAPGLLEHIKTEAATRNALVEPFIRALGYDTSNPAEVVPEWGAHLNVPGVPKDKKIDYAILKDGKPIILIECKCHTDKLNEGFKQLFYYAVATDCRIGVLTNGLIYRFYADLDRANKLDESPFLELDLRNLKEPLLEELGYLTKSSLNIDGMLTAAMQLKYIGGILNILTEQFDSPSDEFVKFFFQRICKDKQFTSNARQQFAAHTKRALRQFIRDRINSSLDAFGIGSNDGVTSTPPSTITPDSADESQSHTNGNRIVTTEEEMEGFYIVKSILRDTVQPDRIVHRDVATYFGILLDDNNRKPICRLYFNNPQSKRLGVFDRSGDEKQVEKIPIDNLDDLYLYADRLKATVSHYVNQPQNSGS